MSRLFSKGNQKKKKDKLLVNIDTKVTDGGRVDAACERGAGGGGCWELMYRRHGAREVLWLWLWWGVGTLAAWVAEQVQIRRESLARDWLDLPLARSRPP